MMDLVILIAIFVVSVCDSVAAFFINVQQIRNRRWLRAIAIVLFALALTFMAFCAWAYVELRFDFPVL